jgi:transcriptional regulator with GAF, ATPase, and Fis domain
MYFAMGEFDIEDISEQRVNNFVASVLWRIVSSNESSQERLKKIVEAISEFFEIGKCSLMIRENDEFLVIASVGLSRGVQESTRVKSGEGMAGMAIEEKKSIFMKKVGMYEKKDNRTYTSDNFIICPIVINKEVIGILSLTDKFDNRGFNERDLYLIQPIIDRIIFVLEGVR